MKPLTFTTIFKWLAIIGLAFYFWTVTGCQTRDQENKVLEQVRDSARAHVQKQEIQIEKGRATLTAPRLRNKFLTLTNENWLKVVPYYKAGKIDSAWYFDGMGKAFEMAADTIMK